MGPKKCGPKKVWAQKLKVGLAGTLVEHILIRTFRFNGGLQCASKNTMFYDQPSPVL